MKANDKGSVSPPMPPPLKEGLRRRFCDDLAKARAVAARDAEDFGPLLAAIEGIGFQRTGIGNGLAQYKKSLQSLVPVEEAEEFHRLFEVVREGRNDAVHSGTAARHLTENCVRLALILEAGLKERVARSRSSWTVRDVMVRSVEQIHPWESVRDARVRMLENAFSYLPMLHTDEWLFVSDLVIARWLLEPKMRDGRASMNCTMEEVAQALPGLSFPKANLLRPEMAIGDALSELEKTGLPSLVVSDTNTSDGRTRLLGMITPFDVL